MDTALRLMKLVKEIYCLRWIGIPLLALAMTFVVQEEGGDPFFMRFLFYLAFTLFFGGGAFFLFLYFRKVYPEIGQTPKRMLVTMTCLLILFVPGSILPGLLLAGASPYELMEWDTWPSYFFQAFIIALVIGLVHENACFFRQWRRVVWQNEALKNQQVKVQLEVLQNQLAPHFLFNSLNTLVALIPENQGLAVEFTQKLSDVYRYVLQNREKELVFLEEELEFTEAYLFLLKMRYPKNLSASFFISEGCHACYIAPMTLQILIENAVKHNVISKAQPLKLEIYTEGNDCIIVENNWQPKSSVQRSMKIGLANIKQRYAFFGDRQVTIIQTTKSYRVVIPLIEMAEEVACPIPV